jgi:prolyl oligopeptidase
MLISRIVFFEEMLRGFTTVTMPALVYPEVYPEAPVTDQVDDYHGTSIADPYRTLEDADSPATQAWVEQENALTERWLAGFPVREEIRTRLTELWNFERFSGFSKAGGRYFYFYNSGLQNQAVLYAMDGWEAAPRALIDPNTYRADGTAALNGDAVSWGGGLMAYAVAQAGSDWNDWRVRDIATGQDLPDLVRWSKGSAPAWAPDDGGFYYTRFPEPPPEELLTAAALHEQLCFHRLGDAQSEDRVVYETPSQPSWTFYPRVTEDGQALLVAIDPGVPGVNLLAWRDLSQPGSPFVDLVAEADHSYLPIETIGSLLYVQTNSGAPRGRVVAIDLRRPGKENWREIVAECAETLESAQLVSGRLLLSYMKDAHSMARIFDLRSGAQTEVSLPGLGTAVWSEARSQDSEAFFNFTGYTIPPGIYRLDVAAGKTALIRQGRVAFESSDYETRQLFYTSKDGTRAPMFVSARRGLKLDGGNPTVLYGYGGFDVALTPNFSPAVAAWMERGGVWVVANLRGGSEYGEAWHKAGMREKKQNVFDDFIAAAEFLIREGYTSTPRLAIFGGSNGGLLVGAVLNQRADLFGAAMPAVGVMDMLRFQKFGYGVQWTGEYGSADNAEDFPVLLAYSPLHNIQAGTRYPPVLVTTADHDDRVMPGHSLKYAAALQAAQKGAPEASGPILIRIETRAGHGAGKPVSKTIDEWADRFTFLDAVLFDALLRQQ